MAETLNLSPNYKYACGDYIDRLLAARIQPSMSRAGCPYDNAMAESFMKTLKHEEVDASQYRDLAHATSAIGGFIEAVYNTERLHSALDYLSPIEFENLPNPWAAAQEPINMLNQDCPRLACLTDGGHSRTPAYSKFATCDPPFLLEIPTRSCAVLLRIFGKLHIYLKRPEYLQNTKSYPHRRQIL